MKKAFIGAVVVLALGGYLWWSVRSTGSTTYVASPTTATEDSASTNSGMPTPTTYTDGTYTGTVENSVYGPVQVAVTIAGGKITEVDVPQYPSDPGHTTEVTNESLPILKQEVITAQAGNVNIVSGATQTSEAFNQSLATALAQAS
jgi:uncharacterized protein with FMN-binding domain